ncbi:MAG: MaoC/PaaZ C-terminal domain-containing protein [Burkholderiales bacterium]|jgi:acyl dehydratase|nr:MaoC/PaaZ C-terminal domain-containing protein [Burkholderiales bacterium]
MALDHQAVGRTAGPTEVSWDSRDAMLYALGVGAGQADPFKELNLTTENSAGQEQVMLPVYGVVITQRASARPDMGAVDRTKLVHAEQGFTLHKPLPLQGTARVTGKITGIFDKGSGALVTTTADVVDAATGELLVSTNSAAFIRGEGGWGGDKGPAGPAPVPTRAPDVQVSSPTRADQALLYRLSGDRNPLHSDPEFARRGGFDKPILHGMCTYGITSRLLIQAMCAGDPRKVKGMTARFTKPVIPGDELTVQAWIEGGVIRFRTLGAGGATVLDFGTLTLN